MTLNDNLDKVNFFFNITSPSIVNLKKESCANSHDTIYSPQLFPFYKKSQ